jgi:hypothetical protein
MGIGVGIFLAAIGAILTFAVGDNVEGVNMAAIGVILMIAGAIGVLLELMLFAPRRRGVDGRGAVVEERRVYDDSARY